MNIHGYDEDPKKVGKQLPKTAPSQAAVSGGMGDPMDLYQDYRTPGGGDGVQPFTDYYENPASFPPPSTPSSSYSDQMTSQAFGQQQQQYYSSPPTINTQFDGAVGSGIPSGSGSQYSPHGGHLAVGNRPASAGGSQAPSRPFSNPASSLTSPLPAPVGPPNGPQPSPQQVGPPMTPGGQSYDGSYYQQPQQAQDLSHGPVDYSGENIFNASLKSPVVSNRCI